MTRKIPELRFAGFSGEWKEKKLDEITANENNRRIPISEPDRKKGTTPYYGANGIVDYIDGYTHDGINILIAEDGASDLSNYPVLITKSKIWVNNHAHVLKSIDKHSNPYFLKGSLQGKNYHRYIVGSSRYKLNRETLMNIKLLIPSISEQEKIGELFETLDACLEDQAAYVETLKKSKKAFLQKLFPKKGAKAPELRFPGFEGNWEEKKIIDVGYISTGKTPSTNNKDYYSDKGYLFITPTDINGNITTDSERRLTNEGMKKSQLAKANTILFTCIASIGKNTMVLEDCCFNQQINAVYLNENNDPYFFLTLSEIISKKMKGYASSGMMQIVNKTEFSNIKEYYPSLPEQEKIGTFFKDLDEKIEKEEDKLKSLERLKLALLQKVFV